MFVLADSAWAIFVKSTLEYAVRAGVRQGITITGTQATAANSNQTAMVKSIVQQNALGLLSGATGLAKIKVNYFLPPAANSNAAMTDVSTQADGNAGLNVMQVSVQKLHPAVARTAHIHLEDGGRRLGGIGGGGRGRPDRTRAGFAAIGAAP